MSAAPASTAPSVAPTEPGSSRGTQRRRRPRNRARPNAQHNQQEQTTNQTNTQVDPDTQTQIQASPQTQQPAQGGGRGGRGRGRGRGRGGSHEQPRFPHRTAGGRQFGGQLTADGKNDTASVASEQEQSSLQADAPEFQPGQPIAPRKQRPPRIKKLQAPKSTAPDIATRTHEDIDNGHYECAICTEEIKRYSRGVWSCRTCWTVFHLSCIKKWSTNEGSTAARQQVSDDETPFPRQWRCPGCNLPKDVLPKSFSCWCEKEPEPKPLPGLPPFSCGQTCARPRTLPKKCPHPCPATCHAGPCAPCALMGPTQNCFCGRKSLTRRCADTNYDEGWSCGDICGQAMPCGKHYCSELCHDGPCGVCEVRIPARCYCGQVQKEILCCDRGDPRFSSQSHLGSDGSAVVEQWIGLFECPNPCGRLFGCGKHTCKKSCHQRDAQPAHCPQSPDVVSYCPCGKTPLSEISSVIRQSCEDPIPYCTKPCGKMLACGHGCTQPCHRGDCMPCLKSMSISCRCGRTTSSTICHQGIEEPPQCMRVCRVSLNCGRHECGERCCSGERKATERQANRRKPRPLNSPRQPDEGFEAEHICTRNCGRQLRCGNPEHRCQELCHKGACGTCREAIFEEISCHCGRTVLQPPLPCGTNPPPCRFQCERPKDCGHPQVAHSCHQDAESCPKCPFLTTKACLCGKGTLKNQPCWLNEVRCGEVCGRTLKCGTHKCKKRCHRPGECEEPCQQSCGNELSVCGHPCMASCHYPLPCKENKPCQQKIFITCECQRIKQEAKCAASTNSEGNLRKVLKCDDECARLERNRKLALALNVDPATHQNDYVPYSADTLNMYQENSTWAVAQEKQLRLFAADPGAKRLRFKPMPRAQRAFLHSLAEDFGFDSESMDPEPHRHVAIFKTPRFVMAPMKTLAECTRIRQIQRVSHPASISATPRQKPTNTNADPYNAFLITNPRFALTFDEVHSVIRSILSKSSFRLELEVSFLPSEEVALKAPIVARLSIPEREMQAMLESIKPALSQAITAQKLGKLQLARLDSSLNILRKESDAGPGSGWSQVAAKGAPVRRVEKSTPFGTKGGFAVLSLSATRKKREKAVEIADDWEAAEEMEEEKERASGANSGVQSEDEGIPSQSHNSTAVGPVSEELPITTKPSLERWSDLDQD